MADFSEIPKGIPRKIAAEHLDNLEDFEAFGEVCSVWRSEIKDVPSFCPSKNIQLPWLILADSPASSYRRFYSLSKRMYRKIDLPRFDGDPEDHRRYFSSKGWLISVSRKHALINFFDPFSGTVINPPSIPILEFTDGDRWDDEFYLCQFSKFIFSTSGRPSCNSCSCRRGGDIQVAMVFNFRKLIAFWRPGQQQWIEPRVDFMIYQVEDVCFFRGEFYSIHNSSQVTAFGSEVPKRPPRIVANLFSQGLALDQPDKFYIVALGSSLLVILKYVSIMGKGQYWTESFQLFELNVDNGKAWHVEDIGNRALFIGHSSTFFVDASLSDKRGCRPNSIYFTDDNSELYDPNNSSCGGGADMGIYSLEEKRVVGRVYEGPSQFSFETPPTWVELPHH